MFPGVTVVLEASAHIGHGADRARRPDRPERAGRHERGGDGQRGRRRRDAIVGALCFVPAEMQIPPRKVVVGNPARDREGRRATRCSQWKTEGTALYQALPGAAARVAASRASRCARCRPTALGSRRRYQTWHETRHGSRRRRRVTRMRLQSYAHGEWVDGHRHGRPPAPRRHRREDRRGDQRGPRFQGHARVRPRRRRARAAGDDVPPARADAQGDGAVPDGAEGRALRVSAATGATKADSWVDIEGGIGTFFAYASKGRREFPDETFYVDGPIEPLSKGGTFVGRHICVPLEGVAVHINAFNFPVLGDAGEARADACSPGMPAIVKPATVTSYPHRGDGPRA